MKDVNRKLKLLVGYDGSECADAIFGDLLRSGLPDELEALVISVEEEWLPVSSSYGMAERGHPADPRAAIIAGLAKQGAERLRLQFPDWKVTSEVFAGSASSAILTRADEWQPDLIVVGSHGRSTLGRLILGSVSQQIVTEARCSVRICRGRVDRGAPSARILIGIDGSPDSDAAINEIAMRPWQRGSEVRVISAFQTFAPAAFGYAIAPVVNAVYESSEDFRAGARKIVDAASDTLKAAGLKVSAAVREGDPKRVIVREAQEWHADSIFVGARGKSALDRLLLGSVSAAVAARSRCSVEVVRHFPILE